MTDALLKGDCLALIKDLPDNSIDSIVTDPPYEIGFMGKAWDNSGIAYNVELWSECSRVLKPGGHLLAFGGSRTYHRLACAVEDAGFEVRDQIMWLYGSGFPKSLDAAKAIDKAAGVEFTAEPASGVGFMNPEGSGGYNTTLNKLTRTGDSTPEAQQWGGWGTALKPAHEPIVVARKPIIGTVANNVLTYGTGALNIDGCRVSIAEGDEPHAGNHTATFGTLDTVSGGDGSGGWTASEGRWPANVIHDGSDEVLAEFPDTAPSRRGKPRGTTKRGMFANSDFNAVGAEYNDEGSAARFFYCAKASRAEREAGLDGLEEKRESDRQKDDGVGGDNPRNRSNNARANHHPTVKPLALMRYLVRLVTPPGGVVLDPFLGSGSTAVAAILEGFDWLGCEITEDYWPIIEARVAWAQNQEIQGVFP